MGGGTSLQRLQEQAGRSPRTLRRWIGRWRQRALRSVPWLAGVVQEVHPSRGLAEFLAQEAPPGLRRAVAEEFRWLDALEVGRAQQGQVEVIEGWAWVNLRFEGLIPWF